MVQNRSQHAQHHLRAGIADALPSDLPLTTNACRRSRSRRDAAFDAVAFPDDDLTRARPTSTGLAWRTRRAACVRRRSDYDATRQSGRRQQENGDGGTTRRAPRFRSQASAIAPAPSTTSISEAKRQAPGADSQGSRPKPPASAPAIAPVVFAA